MPPAVLSGSHCAARAEVAAQAGYKKNLYDAKLKTAYDQFAKDEVKK